MSEPSRPGVGPHPRPWPDDPRLDPELLEQGDRRNVIDRYRYWRVEAIVADLDAQRHPFHVAIENWSRDPNIGAVVRSANAFGAAAVHVVGRRRWNRRGAMMTERYQHVHHRETLAELASWACEAGLPLLGIDNLPGAQPIDRAPLPRACGFWWAIADFQPDPIVDPTLLLEPGRRLFVPSLRVLTDVILGEAGRRTRG